MSTEFNNSIAYAEGWFISETNTTEPWRLEKNDEMGVFDSDGDAWNHVARHAMGGSAYHKAALAFLATNSPMEFRNIVRHSFRSLVA